MTFGKGRMALASVVIAMQTTPPGGSAVATSPEQMKTVQSIASAIAELGSEFPQLKAFSTAQHVSLERLTISYAYRTHAPERRGGWTSGVPNPDDDGIWFHLDLHDRDSQAQIHTQPVTPKWCLAEKRISFLILEGAKTKPLAGRVWSILARHGARRCEDPPGR